KNQERFTPITNPSNRHGGCSPKSDQLSPTLFTQGRQQMNTRYQARWISKQQTDHLKKTGNLTNSLVLESFRGPILVEPAGTNPKSDSVLPLDVADYELRLAWCQGPKAKVQKARQLLGLELESAG